MRPELHAVRDDARRYARECFACDIVYVNVPSDAQFPICLRCSTPVVKIRVDLMRARGES